MRSILLVLPLVAVAVSGCATPTLQSANVDSALVEKEKLIQKEIVLRENQKHRERLSRVSYKLLLAAKDFCPDHLDGTIGVEVATRAAYGKEYEDVAQTVFGLDDRLSIMYVIPGSPADLSGLLRGDVILKVDNQDLPSTLDFAGAVSAIEQAIEANTDTVELVIERAGIVRENQMVPLPQCDYAVLLNNDDSVNAFADGSKIIVNTGLLRFLSTDEDLTVVLAHEIAHNALKHSKAKMTNYAIGTIFDVLAAAYGVNTQGAFGNMAARTYSKEFEAEADMLGLYIMANAGASIEKAPYMWRRFVAAHPGSVKKRTHLATHPTTPERFVAMDEVIAEIKQKIATGQPLRPEYKKSRNWTSQPVEATECELTADSGC